MPWGGEAVRVGAALMATVGRMMEDMQDAVSRAEAVLRVDSTAGRAVDGASGGAVNSAVDSVDEK